MPETLSPTPVRRQHELLARLRSGAIGAIALSGPQALLLRAHGVRKLTLIPNLGLRMSGEAIAEAASHTSTAERSLIAYFGRLSKAKGAALLPALAAQAAPGTFAAYGDGYLQAHLRARIGEDLRTPVSQHELAGIMCWARAVAFPSRWPEPGGIVGIDAQLFGAPLGAFAVGGALDWPSAERFALSDARSLIDWLCAQPGVSQPRDPALIAERQARYWQQVGARADVALSAFASTGRFPQLVLDAVTRDLTFALEQSAA